MPAFSLQLTVNRLQTPKGMDGEDALSGVAESGNTATQSELLLLQSAGWLVRCWAWVVFYQDRRGLALKPAEESAA